MEKGALVAIVLVIIVVSGVVFLRPKPEEKGVERQPTYLGLEVPDEAVAAGKEFTVRVTVKAPESGYWKVQVKVGEETIENTYYLEGGVENTIILTIPGKEVGSHQVSAGDISKNLIVRPAKPAEFHIADVSVPPVEVTTKQTAEIKVWVKNEGELGGDYTARLRVGELNFEESGFIEAERTASISFILRSSDFEKLIGVKPSTVVDVRAEGYGVVKKLHIRKPISATLDYLGLSLPRVGYDGETVDIVALVKNVGDERGSFTIEIDIGGDRGSKTLTLKAGQEYSHTFTKTFSEGTYRITLGEISQDITVLPRPDVRVDELKLPTYAIIGEEVTVGVTIKNHGTGAEPYSFRLEVMEEGAVVYTSSPKSGSLGAGTTTKLSFKFKRDKKGTYTVSVGAKAKIIPVITPFESRRVGDKTVMYTESHMGIRGLWEPPETKYYADCVYEELVEHRGYTCQKWVSRNQGDPDFYEETYLAQMPDGKSLALTHLYRYEKGGLGMEVWWDPALKCWEYPIKDFEAGPADFYMKGHGFDVRAKTEIRFVVLGPETVTWAGRTAEAIRVRFTMPLSGGVVSFGGFKGTGSGTMTYDRWVADFGLVREIFGAVFTFKVGAISGTFEMRYTTELQRYDTYWAGKGP